VAWFHTHDQINFHFSFFPLFMLHTRACFYYIHFIAKSFAGKNCVLLLIDPSVFNLVLLSLDNKCDEKRHFEQIEFVIEKNNNVSSCWWRWEYWKQKIINKNNENTCSNKIRDRMKQNWVFLVAFLLINASHLINSCQNLATLNFSLKKEALITHRRVVQTSFPSSIMRFFYVQSLKEWTWLDYASLYVAPYI
jgi:hypothetical protein